MEPTWGQHGTNLSQLGANLGPCWVHISSSRPSCSNHEGILRPLWAYTTQDAKNDSKVIKFCSKRCQKVILSKLPTHRQVHMGMGNRGMRPNPQKHTKSHKIPQRQLCAFNHCLSTFIRVYAHLSTFIHVYLRLSAFIRRQT